MMTSIINVLTGSFRLLAEKPVLFLPKLVSTFLGALWFIGFLSGTGPLYLYLATAPLLALIGVFVSVMLAGMVRNKESGRILYTGFMETVGRWRLVLSSVAVLLFSSLLIYVPFAVGLTLYYLYGVFTALVVGAVMSVLLLLLFAFLIYFFPISLLEKGSLVEGFRDSAVTSISNSSEVLVLTLFSFALLVTASMTGDRGMKMFGYAGFFALRMVSGVVTTYIFVVSPEYYLQD